MEFQIKFFFFHSFSLLRLLQSFAILQFTFSAIKQNKMDSAKVGKETPIARHKK